MNRKELVDILSSLEDKYPVENWMYGNIHIWPIIKIKLFYHIYLNYIEVNVKVRKKRISFSNQILLFIKSFISTVSLVLWKKCNRQCIFATENDTYLSTLNGQKLNRFYSPFQKKLNKENISLIRLNWTPNLKEKLIQNNIDSSTTINVARLYPFINLFNKFSNRIFPRRSELIEFDNFLSEFNITISSKLNTKVDINRGFLLNEIESIFSYRIISRILLKKLNPIFILELCYYSTFNLAINIEAEMIGTESYEIQHGGLGDTHISYYGWKKFPDEGYKIFPNNIWVWDQLSYDLVTTWSHNQKNINVFIGGNPWIEFIINKYKNEHSFNSETKIVLYTLQSYFIEEYIYAAIKKSSSSYEWWIRPHPGRPETKYEILQKVKELKLENRVNVELATTLPLPLILNNSFIHLSAFSGSIIEANILNVPSIILSTIGVQAYDYLIKNNRAYSCLSKDSNHLLKIINDHKELQSVNKLINSSQIFNSKVLKR